jgi:5-bromo-4-chloroindolyl phosphate hydrolysis protein
MFLTAAILYVLIKNRGRNQERTNQERDIEFVIYKKEIDRLEEQLRRKEISEDNYEKLRKNLEEQHQKNIAQIYRLRAE